MVLFLRFNCMREYVRDYIEIDGASAGEGEMFIKELPKDFIEICRVISITRSKFVDFESIDMCSFPKLRIVNLSGTPNNFDEQNYPCFKRIGDFNFYERTI